MRGGHGQTGRRKHKWTYVLRHEPNYFGKHGFKRSWISRPATINVGELDEQIEQLLAIGLAVQKEGGIIINIDDIGAMKLLGSGKVTHQLIVKARSWSHSAATKIEKAGGQIQTLEDQMIKK